MQASENPRSSETVAPMDVPLGTRVMTGGQAVIRALTHAGADTVFGMPGVDNLPIYDALLDTQRMRHILVRHEQGAGFMADGYARATGRAGICVTTTGPGALNAATALGSSYVDGAPLLLISSQTESALIGRGKGPSHDMRDQLGVFRSLVGWARHADRVEDIPAAIYSALRATQGPRPGPAYLEIPSDVLAASGSVTLRPWNPRPLPCPNYDQLHLVAEWLSKSQRPVLLAGGGIRWSRATKELLHLAECLGAPVITTTSGKGTLPEAHPLSFGVTWGRWSVAHELLGAADLVLAVGTRLGSMDTARWTLPMPERLIHLDLDPDEIGRNYSTGLELIGDARSVLISLLDILNSEQPEARKPWLSVEEFKEPSAAHVRDSLEYQVVRTLEDALPSNVTIVNDAPTLGYWLGMFWPATSPQSFLTTGFGSLGFGLPAALGVRAGDANRPVLALCGDGGILFTGQELATLVHERLPIIILLINDHAYGSVRAIQEQQYHGRTSQVDLTNPDFVAYAASFGIEGRRLDDLSQLSSVLRSAFAAGEPCLIEVQADFDLPPIAERDNQQ